MTPAEAEALGRRWIAAGGGWRKRMVSIGGYTVLQFDSDGPFVWTDGEYLFRAEYGDGPWGNRWPDLRDPATRGAALDVVRERWGPAFQVSPVVRFTPDAIVIVRWRWYANDENENRGDATSEAEALVLALEAAPKAGEVARG